MAKLFALYPPRPDVEASMMAYLEETRAVHPYVLSHALHRVTRQKREFLPSCYEILRAAAGYVRERHRLRRGLNPGYNAWIGAGDDDSIDIDRWLGEQALALPLLGEGDSER